MSYEITHLGSIGAFTSGCGFPTKFQGNTSGKYPFAKVGDISNSARKGEKTISSANNYVDEDVKDILKAKVIPSNSILFAKIGEAIRQNFRVLSSTKMLLDNNSMAFTPNFETVDPTFVLYFLRTIDFYFLASKTTVPSLRKSDLEQIKIPLPPLNTQNKIVEILDTAQYLIDTRKAQITEMDALVQSLFYDMFGDPVSNPKGWEVKLCADIGVIQGGLQVTRKREVNPIEMPYLRVANVYNGFLDLSEIKTIRVTQSELDRVILSKGDILIVEGHGNPNEVGRCAIWDGSIKECLHQNHLIRLRLHEQIVIPSYLVAYWNSSGGRNQLQSFRKTTSGLNTLSANNVRSIQVVLPPIDLQNTFSDRVQKIEAQKTAMTASLSQLEDNFNALMQKAFKGELV